MSTDNGVLLLFIAVCFSGVSGKALHGDELSIKRLWKSRSAPANWREDPRYVTRWTPAGFSYNTPEHSNCNPLLLPEHGRLVCTNEKGLSRTMCLAECMQGYEPTQEFHIFFCSKKGIWSNLYQQVVPPPTLGCIKTKSKQID